jgi:hypothetical protein
MRCVQQSPTNIFPLVQFLLLTLPYFYLPFIVSVIGQDECDKGVLPVTVRVLSNELTDDNIVLIAERNDLPDVVHRAEVYLSPTRYGQRFIGRGRT